MKEELLKLNYTNFEHYGIQKQMPIWIEEMSELTKELCKLQRNYEKFEGDIPESLLFNLKEETIDVQVSLDQLKKAINFAIEEQEKFYSYKVNRTANDIKKEGK